MSNKKNQSGRPQNKDINQKAIQATLKIIEEHGIKSVSLDEVAIKAGTSRPAIYRRWKNKEELIAEAIESQRPDFPAPDTGSLYGDLNQTIENFMKQYGSLLGRQAILEIFGKASRDDAVAKMWVSKYGVPRVLNFQVIFTRAIARGELDSGTDIETIMLILSSVLLQQCLLSNSAADLSFGRTINDVVKLFLAHFGAAPN